MFEIREELKKLPKSPGVYIMYNRHDEIIYVGKAVNLYNRVHSYFRKIIGRGPQIDLMVSQIEHFEVIVTDSELEALVLENNLIKENRPRYNTMLRDDKTYPYIKVTVREDFPRIFLTRQVRKDKARYYGPFSSAGAVRDTLDLIHKAFRIRDCNRILPRDEGKERACLNYHIHQCDAPCQGLITPEDYRILVDEAMEFLNGKFSPVLSRIREEMNRASEAMDFERAAGLRDLLNSVEHVEQKQKITSGASDNRDIVALARDEKEALAQVFFVREGRMVGQEHHYLQTAMEEDNAEILGSFIRQFYSGTPFLPGEIYLPYTVPDAELIREWLSEKKGSKVELVIPKKGQKERLMELAEKNAGMILTRDREKLEKEKEKSTGAVHELEKLTGLSDIHRMEAYDISDISGVESVGSMVVYEDGKPKKSDYRKFRIRTVKGPNDYASLREVLLRRLTDERFSVPPDLILMDGGKGQVNTALGVLSELKLPVPVCGMVKDDRHRTRALWYRNEEIPVDTHSEGFHLVTRIQDEAHRFAIEYHRSLRSRQQVHSGLDEIPGIGEVRRKALMKHFRDIDAIRKADEKELAAVPGMNIRSARAVFDFFHGCDTMKISEKTGKE